MPTAASSPRRRWLRWLAWLAWGLTVLLAVVAGGVWYTVHYFASDEIKRFEEVVGLNGGTIEFRSLRVSDVWQYPALEVTLTDFRLFETTGDSTAEVLYVERARLPVEVSLWDPTQVRVEDVYVRGGHVDIVKGPDGLTNIARVLGAAPGTGEVVGEEIEDGAAESRLKVDQGATFTLEDFDARFADPDRETLVEGLFRRLHVSDLRTRGGFAARLELDVLMGGLQLKAKEGRYLDSAEVCGPVDLQIMRGVLEASAPVLHIGGNSVDVDVRFHTRRDSISALRFGIAEVDLPAARAILADNIRRLISLYDVDGDFAAVTTLTGTFRAPERPRVSVELRLPRNRARVDTEVFEDTRLVGRFLNYPADTTGGRRGSRFVIDSVRTRYYGFDMEATDALVTSSRAAGVNLRATATVAGAASLISPLVQSDEFVFTRGRVSARAHVDGDPMRVMDLINSSRADIRIDAPVVRLPSAGASLPFRSIAVTKAGDRATFDIAGLVPGRARSYALSGELEGLSWLLGTDPDAEVATRVRLSSQHLTWTDVVDLLGDVAAGGTAGGGAAASAKTDAARKVGLKQALTLVESSFRPTIDLEFGRLGYYGLEIRDFRSGMHFRDARTVVLERTSFVLDTTLVTFGGELGIDTARATPFAFTFDAGHLDLDWLAGQLDYLDMPLLRELRPLPNDVSLEIRQRGMLDAEAGILFDRTEGTIDLVSNGTKPFEARVEFEPDRPGVADYQSTRVLMRGSPELFNDFFATENFFFSRGRFEARVGYAGLMPDLRTLVDREAMHLRVSDVAIRFAETDVTLPVHHLDVAMRRDTAEVELLVRADDGSQELLVRGHANNLSEVLLGETGKRFSSDVTVSSPRLVWADIGALAGAMSADSSAVDGAAVDTVVLDGAALDTAALDGAALDTAALDGAALDTVALDTVALDTVRAPVALRETIRGLMDRFEPRVALRIEELQLSNAMAVTQVHGGFYMDAAKVLHLDTTGFHFRGGLLEATGRLGLADVERTPFVGHFRSDALEFGSLLDGFAYFGMQGLEQVEEFSGTLALALDVEGTIAGAANDGVLTDSTRGTLELALRDVTVAGLPALDAFAAKLWMRKRFDTVRLAPVTVRARLEGKTLHLPLTELQSNAISAFVEGQLRFDSTSRLFVSLPLANLLPRDHSRVPELRGYGATRLKVHLDLQQAPAGGLKTKLRLSKRRYYDAIHGEGAWRARERLRRGDGLENDER